ncbi:MAG: DUF4136 domain-containing protein [Bacteroidota bacterium]
MKILRFLPILLLLLVFSSCTTVRVATDYDREANFGSYNKYAFFKPGIDQAQISDLDKKRILRAIDAELSAKGLNKNEQPDILISIFTKERERVDVYNNNFGWGWGWNPWWGGGFGGSTVSRSTEGSLYIDFIDAKTNELVWQGVGSARLITSGNIDKKDERIREIVKEIVAQYPPGSTAN